MGLDGEMYVCSPDLSPRALDAQGGRGMSKHVTKLREQLAWYEGGLIATLSDVELLALVLGGGCPSERAYTLARRVLHRYHLRELRTIEPMALCTEFRLSLLQARRLKMTCALAEHMA